MKLFNLEMRWRTVLKKVFQKRRTKFQKIFSHCDFLSVMFARESTFSIRNFPKSKRLLVPSKSLSPVTQCIQCQCQCQMLTPVPVPMPMPVPVPVPVPNSQWPMANDQCQCQFKTCCSIQPCQCSGQCSPAKGRTLLAQSLRI